MKYLNNYHKIFFFILSLVLILISIYGGARHDYYLYTITWENLNNGEKNIPYNSYGPIHLLLYLIHKLNLLAPKLLFGILFILLSYYIFKKILKKEKSILIFFFYLTIHCNFLIISFVYFYGVNDSLVSLFFVISIIFFKKKKIIFSSIFISLGFLIKFYPILFVPQYLFQKREVALKVMFTICIFIFIFLLSFSTMFDYNLIIEPLKFGNIRDPKFISVLASLNYSFPENQFIEFLKKYNTYLVIILVLAGHLFTLLKKTDLLYSIIFIYIILLTTYKVGHPQFYITLLVISSYLLTLNDKYLIIFKILMPLIILLSLISLGYSLTSGYDLMRNSNTNLWINVRENIGYIFFITNLYVLFRMLLISKNFRKTDNIIEC